MQRLFLAPLAGPLVASLAAAQAPDVIHYTFDGGNTNNSAVPGVGPGTPNASVGFASGPCGNAAALSSAPGARITSGWLVDFGVSSWTIGMFIDLGAGTNAFQYFYGSSSTGGMRCFCAGVAGVNGIMLRTLGNEVILPNGAPPSGVTHCAWVYDSTVPEVRGFVNGVNVVTVPQGNPLNIIGTAADFHVMDYVGSFPMLPNNTMDDFRVYRRALSNTEVAAWAASCGGTLGTNYCAAVANSTGNAAVTSATGSAVAASNDLTLVATYLPNDAFGFFLTSATQGFVASPGGSQGNLCLGGSIGNYVGQGQIRNSGSTGEIALLVDLTQHPTPSGFVAVSAGQTWNFQAWFRDSVGGSATSNFSDGLSIDFQ